VEIYHSCHVRGPYLYSADPRAAASVAVLPLRRTHDRLEFIPQPVDTCCGQPLSFLGKVSCLPDLEADDLWRRALKELEASTPAATWMWISNTAAEALEADTLRVATPTAFAKELLDSRFREALESIVSDLVGRELNVEFVIGDVAPPADVAPSAAANVPFVPPKQPAESTPLNERYIFESFVIGPSNSFAHAAALAVAEQPAQAYNPLFIYGGAGLGKTHLLHAIGHEARRLYPELVVRYVSSEKFMNDFIQGVRADAMAAFRKRYREANILLVDDIQFLSKGEQTQDEFFHTFNALHNDGCQIVISSDRQPAEIPGIEERLRTRFEWGLITDVQPPDLETRVAILQKRASADRVVVPNEVLEFVANRVHSNIRELEGRYTRVVTYAAVNRIPLTRALAEEVLRPLLSADDPQDVPDDAILMACCEYFGVSRDEMLSKSRTRQISHARQIAMYLCRDLTDMSLPRVGQVFGGRDHTTVLHAERKIRQLMSEQRQVSQQIMELTTRLRGGGARRVANL
jgi:chromosomal replication initiator protein